MAHNAIILTPNRGFGEMVRQLLADAAALHAQWLATPQRALQALAGVELLVLDADFPALDVAKFIQQVRQTHPTTKLILILADDMPAEGWPVDALISQPFYLPDLAAALERLYGPLQPAAAGAARAAAAPPTVAHTAPAWLADTKLSAQHLAQLSLESASQAALITRGAEVWAYAGELPQAAAQELAAAISSAGDAGADLARFVRLEATQADYMLYATSLGREYTLALVFDTQVPFSKMRSQVEKLAAAMASASEASLVAAVPQARPRNGEPTAAALPPLAYDVAPAPNAATQAVYASEPSVRHGAVAVTHGGSALQYAYVLLPRLPEHRLEGDLAEKLAAWLPQLCLAFAWRLEHLNIQPGFLQWMVSLPAETAPERVVHSLDQHLSQRIFEEFARMQRENPSGEFFAPGFLVVNGGLPSDAQVLDFIKHTRARQGIPA